MQKDRFLLTRILHIKKTRENPYSRIFYAAIFRSGAGKSKSTKEIATTILQTPSSLKVCKSTAWTKI